MLPSDQIWLLLVRCLIYSDVVSAEEAYWAWPLLLCTHTDTAFKWALIQHALNVYILAHSWNGPYGYSSAIWLYGKCLATLKVHVEPPLHCYCVTDMLTSSPDRVCVCVCVWGGVLVLKCVNDEYMNEGSECHASDISLHVNMSWRRAEGRACQSSQTSLYPGVAMLLCSGRYVERPFNLLW